MVVMVIFHKLSMKLPVANLHIQNVMEVRARYMMAWRWQGR